MATPKTTPTKNVNRGVQPKAGNLTDEIGSGTSFPASQWADFAFGKHQSGSRGEAQITIANQGASVPLSDLIEMRRRDGQTRALLRLFTLPILSCLEEARWIAPEYADGDAEAEVEFANLMFRLPAQAGGMSATLDKVMRYILLSVLEGFSAFEEVRYIPEDGPLKGKVTLRKLAHRHASTIKFMVDEKGGFAGLKQTFRDAKGEIQTVVIPQEKALYFASNEEENPFYGVSFFETAWYHYDIKTKLYYIAHIAAQFAAVPGRIGTYPEGTALPLRTAFNDALASFAFNSSLTVPAGFTVTPFNGTTGFDFIKLIEHHSHLQAKSVLMQFADTENRMVLIDNSSRDASADMYIKALEAIMSQIAETFTNHLMPKYIDWNFGSKNYPVFRFGPLSDKSRQAIAEVFKDVVSSSVLNCTPEFVRELEKKLATQLNLDINYVEIEKNEEEQQKLAAEQKSAENELALLQQQNAPQDMTQPGDATAATAKDATPIAAPPVDAAALAALGEEYTALVELAQDAFMNLPVPEGVVGLEDALGSSRDDSE